VTMRSKPRKPHHTTVLARELRKTATAPELLLWDHLRGRRCEGFKFRRQAPFGRYILDFLCREATVAVEIDGETHNDTHEYDSHRDVFLASAGIQTLRFTSEQVQTDPEGTVRRIAEIALSRLPSPINGRGAGGEGPQKESR
jgi:very-short-patch-repair endonuclease